jgi:tRNA (adenine57-N1/adenine58-N1)-methyltransferase
MGQTEITMYETLQRPHEVNEISPLPISKISEKIKKSEQKREEKRLKQIAGARARDKTAVAMADNTAGELQKHDAKRKREGSGAGSSSGMGSKRLKSGGDNNCVESPVQTQSDNPSELPPEEPFPLCGLKRTPSTPPPNSKIVSKPVAEVRGHTSYLTFACLVPMVLKRERDNNIDVVVD